MIRPRIDFHTHILPEMDDGSKSVEMSIAMLQMEAAQGIEEVVLTPHFYAFQNSPEEFLRRRQISYEKLMTAWTPGLPMLHLGAEVQYFEGICNIDNLNRLCTDGGRLLLLEMPFQKWSSRAVADAIELNERADMQVILAHIERYSQYAEPEMWDDLREHGLIMQSNATFFLNRKTRKKAMAMYRNGEINLMSSDCHNLTTRPPNLADAYPFINKCIG